jgi:hypothetical protein
LLKTVLKTSLISLFLVLGLAQAQEPVRLFDQGETVRGYDTLVQEANLQPGKVLQFDDGSLYEIQAYLGTGNTTIILQAKPLNPKGKMPSSVALRIPKKEGIFKGGAVMPYQEFINHTIDGYKDLDAAHVRIVKKYRANRGEYVACELIDTKMSLDKFFQELSEMDPVLRGKAEKALDRFAISIAGFKSIGDFTAEQVFYDAKADEWILADWTSGHERGTLRDSEISDLFDHYFVRGFVRYRDKDGDWVTRLPTAEQRALIDHLNQVVDEKRRSSLKYRICLKLKLVQGY